MGDDGTIEEDNDWVKQLMKEDGYVDSKDIKK